MADVCDCEHNTHDPAGTREATAHEFAAVEGTVTVKSPWGGTFRLCQWCVDAGHMQGLQFR